MKIKSLLIGMLASVALVGCTNEDPIDAGNEELKQSELTRGDAYVNFVINTKTDSSRGTTTGDNHESAENSTHTVAGTAAENQVHELLLVVAKATDNSTPDKIGLYADVKDEESNSPNGELAKVRNGYVGYFTYTEKNSNKLVDATTQGNKVVQLNTPIRLDYTGKYAVLAVVNPDAKLKASIVEGSDHNAAYKAILAYEGDAYNKTNNTYFQMTNKKVCLINATPENNNPGKPVLAEIDVERTVSKATWRWKDADATLANSTLKTLKNLYPVNVTGFSQTPVQGTFWYMDVANSGQANQYKAYIYSTNFNKATSTDGNTYWVLFKKDSTDDTNTDDKGQIISTEVEAIFKAQETYVDYKGVTDVDPDNQESSVGQEKIAPLFNEDYTTAKNRVTDAFVRTLSFVYDASTAINEKYYVHLTHYALTNLTPTVYAVRHIDNNGETPRIMGELGSSEYLYTPFYEKINSGETVTFNQKLDDVKTAAAAFANGINETNKGIFNPLPTGDNVGNVGTAHGNVSNVGGFMSYLYENSCKNGKLNNVDIANPETVTGIVLAGDIYTANGEKVKILYKYNEKYYRTLQALIAANGDKDSKGNNIGTFTHNGKTITPNSTNDDAKAAGIDVYPQGRCYYYSADIKHYDDGKADEIGVMEYAIMRNNIYSLAVNSIDGIGDARVTVTENNPLTDIRSYVQLKVTILPWIVRFNDLNL